MGGGTVKTPEQIAARVGNVVLFLCQLATGFFGAVGIYGAITGRLDLAALTFAIPITITAVRAILKEQDDG